VASLPSEPAAATAKGKSKAKTKAATKKPDPAPPEPVDEARADPPTMGYFPAHPAPPREIALGEAPPPLAAPRTPVQSQRLAPPG